MKENAYSILYKWTGVNRYMKISFEIILAVTIGNVIFSKLASVINSVLTSYELEYAGWTAIGTLVSFCAIRMLSTIMDEKKMLFEMAIQDELTGLYNLRFVNKTLEKIVPHDSSGMSLYICLIDVNNFKQINDVYGHAAGDCALKIIAHKLKEVMRESDIVARIGGDEFLVIGITKDTDLEIISSMPDRITAAISTISFYYKDLEIPLSVSVGIAKNNLPNSDKKTKPEINFEDLKMAADKYMYEMKKSRNNNQGRNEAPKGE